MQDHSPPVRRRRRGLGMIGLAAALVAGTALVVLNPRAERPAPAGRISVAAAWPEARRADLPGNLADGPIFHPELFLDARTAVGTAPSPDGGSLRLVLRDPGGAVRELRRLPLDGEPEFGNVTAAGDDLVWTESGSRTRTQIWTANRSDRTPARRLTTDTGDAVFYGSQYDLVVADRRVYWAAAAPPPASPSASVATSATSAASAGGPVTEIRSVALVGGPVRVRAEPGTWGLNAWPWLTDGPGDQTGTRRLRNLATGRDIEVRTSGTELTTCGPVWCRAMVLTSDGLARIDLMHPDGTARRRIAGSTATAAITDVAVLDRFEVLSETGPDSDVTGTAGLLVYDNATGRTVTVSAAVDGAFSRGGVLWWSTGDQDSIIWHTVDLRTV